MGLMKLFQRWMLFSTTLTLQIAVTSAFHYGAWRFENLPFFIVDVNIKQNLEPLNLSIYIQ